MLEHPEADLSCAFNFDAPSLQRPAWARLPKWCSKRGTRSIQPTRLVRDVSTVMQCAILTNACRVVQHDGRHSGAHQLRAPVLPDGADAFLLGHVLIIANRASRSTS